MVGNVGSTGGGAPPSESATLSNLLDVMADPKAARKRLKELTEQEAAARQAEEDLQAELEVQALKIREGGIVLARAEEERRKADASLAELKQQTSTDLQQLDAERSRLTAWDAELVKREEAVNTAEFACKRAAEALKDYMG